MAFFDFHHHHADIAYGIFNHMPGNPMPKVPFSVGIHPRYILQNWEVQWEEVLSLSSHPLCKAIGECGLDAMSTAPENIQQEVFIHHILLANELQKPIMIHCVRKFHELLIFKKKATSAMVIHGFNKKFSIAEEMLQHGFYLSFGSSIMQNLSLQTVLQKTPLNRMFLETDDSSANLEEIYLTASRIKEISVEQLIDIIEENKSTIGLL